MTSTFLGFWLCFPENSPAESPLRPFLPIPGATSFPFPQGLEGLSGDICGFLAVWPSQLHFLFGIIWFASMCVNTVLVVFQEDLILDWCFSSWKGTINRHQLFWEIHTHTHTQRNNAVPPVDVSYLSSVLFPPCLVLFIDSYKPHLYRRYHSNGMIDKPINKRYQSTWLLTFLPMTFPLTSPASGCFLSVSAVSVRS